MITATNKATGEVIELPSDTLEDIVAAWRVAQEYDKAATALKDQLKELARTYINDAGISEEVSNFVFKRNVIQRMTYDKATLRDLLDEDTYDVLTKPDKPTIDKYIKENLESLGSVSTQLRQAMIPDGKPYEVIKLEKLSRDE